MCGQPIIFQLKQFTIYDGVFSIYLYMEKGKLLWLFQGGSHQNLSGQVEIMITSFNL